MTFRSLKREAKQAAQARGHKLSRFVTVCRPNPLMGVLGTVGIAECKCGAWVQVETRKQASGIATGGSFGRAVAVDCEA